MQLERRCDDRVLGRQLEEKVRGGDDQDTSHTCLKYSKEKNTNQEYNS